MATHSPEIAASSEAEVGGLSIGRFVREGAADLIEGARRWELWGTLGWHDIRQRYRRSVIGPFWITLSMGFMIGGLGFLYAALLRQPTAEYLPYLTVGLTLWSLIALLINEGAMTFFIAEGAIKQMPVPLSIHVYRMVWRNTIIFLHNVCIVFVVMAVFNAWPGWSGLMAVPGLAVVALNGIAISMTLGILSARFRDIPPIIANVTQMLFFLTPIIWSPELLQERRYFIALNPFYYLIEIVRLPLLGSMASAWIWLAAGLITLANAGLAFALFARFRRRLPYWV